MHIRSATLDDRLAIDSFASVTVHDTYGALVSRAYADELLDRWWGTTLDPDIRAGNVTIAVEHGHVIGLAHVGQLEGDAVLWKLYVGPDRRSAGVGQALIEHVIAALPADSERLVVEHIAANVDAARFFRRHGFQRTHANPNDDVRLATVWRSRPIGHHGADASHGHTHDQFDWSELAGHMLAWDQAQSDLYRDMVSWLGVRPGMHVAEVGSGAGGFAAACTEQVGADGRIVLIDGDPELLDLARSNQPPGANITTLHADLETADLAVRLTDRFDLVHASGVVHHTDDQQRTIADLAALLEPGGRLVLGEGGLTARFLPSECGLGEPDIEGRLQAAVADWFWTDVRPAGATVSTNQGWGSLLEAAGLSNIASGSFLLDISPPLDSDLRTLVARSLTGAAQRAGSRLSPDDHGAITALVDPARPDGVHRRNDVFILAVRTLHVGTRV